MSVVGFDIGNENCVISVVKQRGIDVLLNDESKRETPSVVCFGEKQRILGSAGAASATMNPRSTIFQVKRLIGLNFSEPHIKDELKMFPFETSEGPDGGILIHLQYLDLQRRAYLYAAEIAGLKPLRLLHDCTATALGYGIYKTDFSSAAQFKEQYNIDVYSNVRASVRLRVACEKLKKVLSANAEAPLNIECLMDEKDVKGFIKREEFENLASGLFERIRVPCNQALSDARLTVDKIHAVELVGSGSRIPAISRLLASLFRREPRRTLNVSECVARGCALQCAMLSPIFRVRDYEWLAFRGDKEVEAGVGRCTLEDLSRVGNWRR
ncbi:Heat shock 70 kDa protein 16 [Vitis vinifera]|uniref:Heat shock 70 kDa protein 16 n=1 Tax=Vitis vinifera TaxID=29760 RepID=A0A438IS32_VITVI|nr:Heat shock 70 kDa protein 16 [Vitis vinifera]